MRHSTSKITRAAALVAAAGLALMAGSCSSATEGDGPETRSQRLFSATTQTESGETATFEFSHTAAEGWTVSVVPESGAAGGMEIRRQAQFGSGSSSGGNSSGSSGGSSSGGSSASTLSGASPATVEFYGGAASSSRFRGQSNANSRFSASSPGTSNFEVTISGGTATCRPTAVCDYAKAVCEAYVNVPENQLAGTESCQSSEIQKCYGEVERLFREAERGSFAHALLCLLSPLLECATQGIRAAGSISSNRQFERAIISGIQQCGYAAGDLEIEVEASGSVNGSSNNSSNGPSNSFSTN